MYRLKIGRGQPPLIVVLACGSLRANRAVTVFMVAPLWLLPCSLHLQSNATPRLSLPGHMSFPPANHAVTARFRFTPPSFTAPHISPLPFLRFIPLHSLFHSGTCHLQRSLPKQKLRQPCRNGSRPPPSSFGLPAASDLAPLVVGSRSTHRLILRSVSLLSHFALLSTHAQGCFPCLGFNPASPTPAPDHPPLKCS